MLENHVTQIIPEKLHILWMQFVYPIKHETLEWYTPWQFITLQIPSHLNRITHKSFRIYLHFIFLYTFCMMVFSLKTKWGLQITCTAHSNLTLAWPWKSALEGHCGVCGPNKSTPNWAWLPFFPPRWLNLWQQWHRIQPIDNESISFVFKQQSPQVHGIKFELQSMNGEAIELFAPPIQS